MTKEDLIKLKKDIMALSEDAKKERNLYLRGLANGEIQGPPVGYASVDKPGLKYYSEDQMKIPDINKTCYRYVLEENEEFQDDVAIIFLGKKIRYKDFLREVEKTAKALKKMNVNKGDVVTICMPNTPESAYLFYACSKIGAIADFIDPREKEEGLEKYLNISNPKNLFVLDMCVSNFENLIAKKNIENVVIISPVETMPKIISEGINLKERILNKDNYRRDEEIKSKWKKTAKVMTYKDFIKNGESYTAETEEPYEPNRPVAIVHTGGTTGVPKGVLLSNDNLNELTNQLIHSDMPFERHYLSFGVMPEFVGYGLSVGLHSALVIGMENMMIPKYEPEKIPNQVLKYKPNVLTGSPAHWEIIYKSGLLKNKNIDLSFFKSPAEGGDTLNVKMEEEINQLLKERGCEVNIQKGYGMTEKCSVATVTFNNEVNTLGGVGIPLLKTDLCVCDENLDELGYDQIGEICVKSPDIMLEYFNNQEETDKVLRLHPDGSKWLHSGDLGYVTKDGILYVVGRIKDIIIEYDGKKVYPFNIETILAKNSNVENIAIVGVPDPKHINGEIPVAFVVLNDENDEKKSISNLKDFALKNVPNYAMPADYVIVDQLPKTKVGKVDKKVLKDLYNKTNDAKILKK